MSQDKYPRTSHLPWTGSHTSDDRVAISVESFIGKNIVITEKMDGSNASITKGGVYGRSHVEFSRNAWDREMWNIHSLIRNDLSDGVYVFGENMEGIHSIEYSNLDSYFFIFGVRDNNIWISWDDVEEYSYLLDIPTVPVLYKGVINSEDELKKLTLSLCSQPSSLGGQREGVVVRNAGIFHNDDFSTNVIKWVRKGHVATDIHWTRNWKKAKIKKTY
jgi:hypothetical protein